MTDVFYEETIDASPEALADLVSRPDEWLSEAAADSSAGAEKIDARLRVRFGHGPLGLTVHKRAHIEVGEISRKKGSVTVPLTWEASGYSGLFPVMDGVMQVLRVGPTKSRLVFWGRYDPPLGRPGQLIDKYIAHQVAEATVRGFVRAVARRLADMERPLAG